MLGVFQITVSICELCFERKSDLAVWRNVWSYCVRRKNVPGGTRGCKLAVGAFHPTQDDPIKKILFQSSSKT